MSTLRPEERVIEELFRQYPDGRINPVETIHSGLSGSTVMLVSVKAVTPGSYQGLAFAKIDRREFIALEVERHLQARAVFAGRPFQPVPTVIGPFQPVNMWSMLLYQPAHNVIGLRSLGELVSGAAQNPYGLQQLVSQSELMLDELFNTWHGPEALVQSCIPQPVPTLLRDIINIGGKNRLSEVENRLHTYDIPGREHVLVAFKPAINLEFPNPFAYLLRPELWDTAPAIVAPRAPTHGDLHGNNIICRMDPGIYAPTPPWLIDFAVYHNEGLPFFDLAYLELDLLLRSLPAHGAENSWQNWRVITEHLTSATLPPDDMPGLETQAAWALVRPIRKHLARILAAVADRPGMHQSFSRSWWLAATAAGTLITRRSRAESREQRVVTLLYAARSLARLLESLNMSPAEGTVAPILWREPLWDQESPFPGLKPFKPAQASIFFGRNREISEVQKIVLEQRFAAVVGASGSGKSSLVWAGVLPRLEKGADDARTRHWLTVRFTPGGAGNGDPFAALVSMLHDKLPAIADEDMLAVRLAQQPDIFEAVVARALEDYPPEAELLLFIDQFEEIFSLVLNAAPRLAFVRLLAHVARSSRIRAIITMRADFYQNCFDVPGLVDLLQRHYMLRAPDQLSLAEMITRPASRANLTFEKGLVERILLDTGMESGALALMAYTLSQLYQRREGRVLTHAAYLDLGGVQGAIATRAEQVFKTLGQSTREALSSVFQQLVAVDDENNTVTRQRAHLEGFRTNLDAIKFLQAFANARLLVTDQDREGRPTIEVAHEALLLSWPTLASWINEMKEDLKLLRKLRRDAEVWRQNNYDRELLWRHGELVKVGRMVEHLKPNLSPEVRYFIRPEYEWLLDDPNTSHFRRADLGDWLISMGDPRRGTGLRPDGLPDIAWCNVPNEPFKISLYPITYRQYLAFIQAPDGYTNPLWWEGLTDLQLPPGEQEFKVGNRPAEHVSWYDAMAFCRWLSARLFPDLVSKHLDISAPTLRLPTPTVTDTSDLPAWLRDFTAEQPEMVDPTLQMVLPPKAAKQLSEILASYQTARSQLVPPAPDPVAPPQPPQPSQSAGKPSSPRGFSDIAARFRNLTANRPFTVQDTQMTTEVSKEIADQQMAEYLRAARAHSAALFRTMPIRLPTETEWQQAAGLLANYPWGEEWNPAFANTLESRLARTTAVGMYPPGRAPSGAMDMSGNIWEWTLTDYSTGSNEDLVSTGRRVLRGGSWQRPRANAQIHVRFAYSPEVRYDDVGFRVVLAIPSIEGISI